MDSRTTKRLPQFVLLLALLLAWGWNLRALAATDPKDEAAEDTAGFKEFMTHVKDYMHVHKSAESSLPALRPTDRPELILEHQQKLAQNIRKARPHARRGDLFTHHAREAFRHAIYTEFHGPPAPHAKATLKQGDPLPEVHLRVNQEYPKTAPFTTVPPTLLLKFPKLPDELTYRIVGHDLVLYDVKANLAVDALRGVIP
ncbi:MAG: hypothetical protein PHX83_13130 [Acidobacteriia bacterium]|nr:hypothetical protein [Terriglobia bacterium]